jgi:hypothetical protein
LLAAGLFTSGVLAYRSADGRESDMTTIYGIKACDTMKKARA